MQLLGGVAATVAMSAPIFASAQPQPGPVPAGPPPASTPSPQAPASAQPPARQEQAPGGQRAGQETITVTGQRSHVQTSIDRVSYSVANDLQGATGSMADVLRNVPSVEVDPEGNVSLRGDPNVVILIDGQPSGRLRGPDRGVGLQQLPAGQYERVEVMTNPSAAYGPEGSGGVINLVTRRVRRAGLSGSARLNLGTRGRANGGVSGAYVAGPTTLSGDLGGRRDELSGSSDRLRERLDPATNRFRPSRQQVESETETLSGNVRAAVEHTLGPSTRVSLDLNGSTVRSETQALETFAAELPAPGGVTEHVRTFDTAARLNNGEVRGRLTRTFGDSEHRLSVDAAYQSSNSDRRLRSETLVTFPAGDRTLEDFRYLVGQDLIQLRADYVRPLGGSAKLQLGYEFERQDNEFDNSGARGGTAGALANLPSFSNRFLHDQTVNSLYGTYERKIGDLTALAGLRLEQVELMLDQVTTGERFGSDYFRAYPTLHLSYQLTEKEQLRASYSRRVQRPQGQDLNPFREYRDPFNLRAGNPRLRPQETDSMEVGWQRRAGSTFYQATLYHRTTRGAFTDLIEELGGGILLTRRENLGHSRATGLELVANRPITPTLTMNASVNGSWTEIDSRDLGFPEGRSGFQIGGRGSLSWRPSPKDHLQISGFLSGRSLRPQGYRGASGMINLGYRRQLSDPLSFVATVRDLLGKFGETVVYETPTFRDRAERSFGGRVVMVGVNYTFGSTQRNRRDPSFDFEAGRSD